VRQIPIEVKDTNTQTGSSGQGPVIEDVTGHESSYGPEVHGTVIVDEDDENLPSAPSSHEPNIPSSTSRPNHFMPSAPPPVNVSDYNNDIEEEMIRAAIEASKREAEGMTNVCFCFWICQISMSKQNFEQNPLYAGSKWWYN
jgi:hypothetical protein